MSIASPYCTKAEVRAPCPELENLHDAGVDACEAGTTASTINATAHAAEVGDTIALTSGALSGESSTVATVSTNALTVSPAFTGAPAAGVAFTIRRPQVGLSDALLDGVIADSDLQLEADLSGVLPTADLRALDAIPGPINRLSVYLSRAHGYDRLRGNGVKHDGDLATYWRTQYDALLDQVRGNVSAMIGTTGTYSRNRYEADKFFGTGDYSEPVERDGAI
jgi:hypothetical protein